MSKWLLLILCTLFAETAEKKICLNMIVKNESGVITRCLKTVKPYIDHWVIVDTGSTDGTQKIIQEFMQDIPGELHEQPWVDFAHNRNQALHLAKGKGDYLLFIDADEELEGTLDKNSLSTDVYIATLRNSRNPPVTSQRFFLVSDKLDLSWRGVVHEYLECSQDPQMQVLPDLIISVEAADGARSRDPNKYLKDAQVLEKALLEEPDNSNYVYYLGQSYYCAKKWNSSLKAYQKRAQMSGWDQHTFWAKYYTAQLLEMLERDPDHIIKSYLDAYQFRPTRVEPICRLATYFYTKKNYLLGYLLGKFGQTFTRPDDNGYVEDWMYTFGSIAVQANCALGMGKRDEAIALYEKILQCPSAPQETCDQARSTIKYLIDNL